jgi:hypothetical protein
LTAAPAIATGVFHAYFLFDVADTIDLEKIAAVAGATAQRAPLRTRAVPSPGRIQFAVPPLSMSLPEMELGGRVGSVRAKIFDYGVISIRISFPHRGTWTEFAGVATALRSDDAALAHAERALASVLSDHAGALDDPHAPLVEDYYIHTVETFAEPIEAATLLGERGTDLVALLTADARPLGAEELRESLRSHFTYYPDDLVVVLWDSAFVYDDAADARVIEDILEFANSQLVEFRTYDARLDAELDDIYALEAPKTGSQRPLPRRAAEKRAAELRYLLADVRELTDRAGNALKMTGDAYYARVYRAIAVRLGLDDWQRQVDTKLDSVGEVYRFIVDQAETARSEFLEVIVIVLIAIEVVVGILGLRH